jgi:Nickel responsive protein SCO4226-like
MLYTAKCYWPGLDEQQLERVTRKLLRRNRERDGRASYLGSIVFLADQLVLCLFDASSKAAVRQASERAGLPCERVMEATWLTSPNSRALLGQGR